jgi:hypothetical protein
MSKSFAECNPELYPPDDIADEIRLESIEREAKLEGWPVDRPWVKPHHALDCQCHQCVPHIVHDEPVLLPWRHRSAYPCGQRIAFSNRAQYDELLDGASHGTHYGDSASITCPRCLELRRR